MGLFDAFGNSDSAAQKYLQQALSAYQQANVPTIQSEQVGDLPLETVQGTVNPNTIQVAEQAPSSFNNISLDPTTRAAQIAALSQYTDIANSGGLDAESKLALQQAIDAANTQSQGAQGAIMKSAQAQGQGGGDFALTQRALAAQGASNNAATQGMQAAAMSEANREAALNAMANIGGGINASDYAQAAQKASAQNAINATNQSATNAANTGNVANQIQAGEFNVGNAQGVNTRNTVAGQGKAYYNASLPQQQFNNELAKAGGIAGVSGSQATAAQNAQNANLGFTGSLLGAGATIGGAMVGGPVGAAAGKTLAGGTPVGNAPGIGAISTPKTPSQYKPVGYSSGGYTCYADGGIAHDHTICEKLGRMNMTGGGPVVARSPEETAEVPGDSKQNDKIHADLSEGELVIPRSVPKDGPHMEEFARNAPVGGDTKKKVDLTSFTSGYKRGK